MHKNTWVQAGKICYRRLDQRAIKFKVFTSGSAEVLLKKEARKDFETRPWAQQIWFTHSRTKAETSLRDMADDLLEENRKLNQGPDSVAHTFVGTDGIMMKTTTMDAVKIMLIWRVREHSCNHSPIQQHLGWHRKASHRSKQKKSDYPKFSAS